MEPGAPYQAAIQAQVGGSGGLAGKTTSRGHQGALVVAPRHERAQLHRESQDLLAGNQRLYGQVSWAMQAAMQAAAAGWLARVTSKGSDANAPGASVPMPPTPPQRHHTHTWEWAGEGRGTEDGVRERGSRRVHGRQQAGEGVERRVMRERSAPRLVKVGLESPSPPAGSFHTSRSRPRPHWRRLTAARALAHASPCVGVFGCGVIAILTRVDCRNKQAGSAVLFV